MLIGIDANEANVKTKVGIGVYAFHVLWGIYNKVQSAKCKVQSYSSKFKIYLKEALLPDLPPETDVWKYQIVKPKRFWTQAGLPVRLWLEKLTGKAPDVFLSLTHYAPRFSPIPAVICIMDLAFIRFPEMFLKKDLYQLKNWTDYSVRQAGKIITISEFSKREIVDYYHVSEDKVVVAYPGIDMHKSEIRNPKSETNSKIQITKRKYSIDGPYLLFVGTVQPRKNLTRMLEAFLNVKCQMSNVKTISQISKLVVCGMVKEGRGGWMEGEFFRKIKELNLEKNVVITGYVDDNDLPYLTAGAKALVLPSLYEGFGIPVLEAMAAGTPVVVSKTSSLPEVCGKAAIYIDDPYSVDSITDALLKVLSLIGKERENLVKSGLQQAKKFSWEETVRRILEVLEDLRKSG